MDTKLLSRPDALDFLHHVLNINICDSQTMGLKTLNLIIEKFFEEIPFQNLYVLQTHRVPSFEEIKANMFNRVGGLCFELNLFMGQLLLALDYNVHMVCGFENAGEASLHHAFLIVENVETNGDLYCVDVGFGYPMFFAIPLHNLESGNQEKPGYALGYWQFKFTHEADGQYCLRSFEEDRRDHRVVEFIDNIQVPKGQWCQEYSFILKPLSYVEALEVMEPVYAMPLVSYFLVNFHCVLFKDKLAMGFKNKALLRENIEDHRLRPERIFMHFSDLKESVLELFPQFDEKVVELGLNNLEANQMNAPHLVANVKSRKKSICQERFSLAQLNEIEKAAATN